MIKVDPANLEYRDVHELLVGAVAPRPIAWVSTVGEDGVFNLAPYSFFTAMSNKPALVGFSIGTKRDGQRKDTVVNIEFSRDFVIAVVTEDLAEVMNQTSADYANDADEFKEVGLTPVPADIVKAPLVAESSVNMECRLWRILDVGIATRGTDFVIGEVLRVHIKDDLYVNDEMQISGLWPVARMGAQLYCRTKDVFEMKRPFIFS